MSHISEVLVVGAGPAGSSVAYYLSCLGVRVHVIEKAKFPRDKICGDGLTPRAVTELVRMGIDISDHKQWPRNYGIRAYGAGHTIEVPWPELSSMPNYGLAKRRKELDHLLIQRAVSAGATLDEETVVTAPILHERTGCVIGVKARKKTTKEEVSYYARLIVDAGGVAARLATSLGRVQNQSRPMGVAHRTYIKSPLAATDMMESQLELWEGKAGQSAIAPGYGWAWPVSDSVVNVGLGSLSSHGAPKGMDYRSMFATWMENAPKEWEFTEENQLEPLRGAALPMGFNRKPLYERGLLLVGDAGGMVSPFNGEGIAYALQSGRVAADIIAQALSRTSTVAFQKTLEEYPKFMKNELGGYYTMGRIFAYLIEKPVVMQACVKYGLPRPMLMRLVMKLLSDAYDKNGGDWMDRLIATLAKVVPGA
ncbi:MAG: geranylgeranyl reductase family protein [Actinomycetaceae bacterium]|nr:geranylgeranyl reductase family protein [Actinomycetaceae bacterium]